MNKKEVIKALRDTAQSASNVVAAQVSDPIDVIASALRKCGVDVSDPVMGAKWMADKGLTVKVDEGVPKLVGESIGMVTPVLIAAKPSTVAKLAEMVK